MIAARCGASQMGSLCPGAPYGLAEPVSGFLCSVNLLLPTSPHPLLRQRSALPRGLKALPAHSCSLSPYPSQTLAFCMSYSGWHLLFRGPKEAQEALANGKENGSIKKKRKKKKNHPLLAREVTGKVFRYPFSGHFQKFKETGVTVKEKIFSPKLFSSVSTVPSSITLRGSSYTYQVKFFFYAMTGKFPCQVVGDSN